MTINSVIDEQSVVDNTIIEQIYQSNNNFLTEIISTYKGGLIFCSLMFIVSTDKDEYLLVYDNEEDTYNGFKKFIQLPDHTIKLFLTFDQFITGAKKLLNN